MKNSESKLILNVDLENFTLGELVRDVFDNFSDLPNDSEFKINFISNRKEKFDGLQLGYYLRQLKANSNLEISVRGIIGNEFLKVISVLEHKVEVTLETEYIFKPKKFSNLLPFLKEESIGEFYVVCLESNFRPNLIQIIQFLRNGL